MLINGLKKCFNIVLSMILFILLVFFIQMPVISWLDKSYVNLGDGLMADTLRIILFFSLTTISLLFLYLYAKRLNINLKNSFLTFDKKIRSILLKYVLITLFITLIYLVLMIIANGNNVGTVPKQIANMTTQPVTFLMFMMTSIISQPILEEVLFRGILQEKLSRYSIWLAIIVSSLIFSYVHGYETIINTQLFSSIIYGMLYKDTKNLKAPILLHMAQNLLVLMIVIIFK